jgi:hypothetical protein
VSYVAPSLPSVVVASSLNNLDQSNSVPVGEFPKEYFEGYKREPNAYNSVVVMGLKPGTKYLFRIYAGNRFDYEQQGKLIEIETLAGISEKG